jgi:hypothetical protein
MTPVCPSRCAVLQGEVRRFNPRCDRHRPATDCSRPRACHARCRFGGVPARDRHHPHDGASVASAATWEKKVSPTASWERPLARLPGVRLLFTGGEMLHLTEVIAASMTRAAGTIAAKRLSLV